MPLAGGSRAAQYMLLEQALREAKPATAMRDGDYHLLTPAGRETLARIVPRDPVDRALEHAFATAPGARDPQLVARLDAVAGRVLG